MLHVRMLDQYIAMTFFKTMTLVLHQGYLPMKAALLAAAVLLAVAGVATAVQGPAFAQKRPIAPGGNAAIKPASDVQV